MKRLLFVAAILAFSTIFVPAQPGPSAPESVRVEPNERAGFTYPYYLYVPPELTTAEARKTTQTILVLPNNTGSPNDSFEFHEEDVKRRMALSSTVGSEAWNSRDLKSRPH